MDPRDLRKENIDKMTREWMAATGYRPPRPSWLKQLISRIRTWLRMHGFGVNHLSDDEILTILARAAKAEVTRRGGKSAQGNGVRFSLDRTPKSVEDFQRMEAHPRPPKAVFSTVKELYDIYKREYLGQTIQTISGHRMTFKPGHFFRLIAGTPSDGSRKGFISKASSGEDAIRLIESGKVKFSDIAGYEDIRGENIKLFKDVLTDGDFYYEEASDQIVFGKKYASISQPGGFMAVTLKIDSNGNLGPRTFHPRKFTVGLLEGKNIKWNIGDKSSASPKIAAGKSAEKTSGFVNDNIQPSGEKSSGNGENGGNGGITRASVREFDPTAGNSRAKNVVAMLRPLVGRKRSGFDHAKLAAEIKTRHGVDVTPAEVAVWINEAIRKNAGEMARNTAKIRNEWLYNNNALWKQAVDYAGSENFKVRVSERMKDRNLEGTFWLKKGDEKSANTVIDLDALANEVARQQSRDALDVEQEFFDFFNGLTKSGLNEQYNQYRREQSFADKEQERQAKEEWDTTNTCGKKRICARIWLPRGADRVAIPRWNTPATMIIYRSAAKSQAEDPAPAQVTFSHSFSLYARENPEIVGRGVANAFGRVIFNVEQRFRHGAGRRSERMFIMIAPSRSRVPDLIRAGGKALCFKANLSCPRAAEIAGMHGFDALWVCREHVPTGRSAMENFIRAEFGGPGL